MSNLPSTPARQQGVILVVTLLLLLVLTMLAVVSVEDSSVNLMIVGNTQHRKVAEATAQAAIEKVLATPSVFEVENPDPVAETISGWPVTVQAKLLGCPCSSGGGGGHSLWGQQHFNVSFGNEDACWDLTATVDDAATNTRVVVHQGVLRQQSCPASSP